MDPAQQQLALLRQNPANWSARAELAEIWREQGVPFGDGELLAGATGAPGNRVELQKLLDALGTPPTTPPWVRIFDEYLQWAPGCPLGMVALAHALEESDPNEALALYNRAVEINPDVADPPLACLRQPEPVKPAEISSEEEPGRLIEDNRFISLMVAIGAHVILILVFCFWGLSSPPTKPPSIVVSPPAKEKTETKKARPKQSALTTNTKTQDMQIVSSPAVSDVALSLDLPKSDNTPFFSGDDFNPSMSFGGNSGGAVSFFGSQGKTKNMVYVVDVSGSMRTEGEEGKSRLELMKRELKRSVSALPFSVKYQIIFFSNTAWFAGQTPEGVGAGFNDSTDPHSLPTRALVRATQSQKRKTLAHIDEVSSGGGTNWRLPLKMAIKLKPDLIYFMTDGEIDSDSGEVPVIEDVVNYNRKSSNAKINTICLMELKAYEKLQDLASRTRGTVFLVKEDGTVLRGLQLDQER